MPVTGLPVLLESSMNTLMQESCLSFFKIISNSNGTSTIVVHFADMTQPDSELPHCPPRPKHPSKLKRDRERRVNYFSTKPANLCSSLQSEPSSPPSPSPTQPCQESPIRTVSLSPILQYPTTTDPSSIDSGVVCRANIDNRSHCETDQTRPIANTSEDEQRTDTESTPTLCDVVRETVFVESSVSVGQSFEETLSHCSDPEIPELSVKSTKQSDGPHRPADRPRPYVNSRHISEPRVDTHKPDCGFFRNIDDLHNATLCRDNLPRHVQRRLHDPSRNLAALRVAKREYSLREGGQAIVAETDDMLLTFFPDKNTIGPVHVFSETDRSKLKDKDKSLYEEFLLLSPYRSRLFRDDITIAIAKTHNFMRKSHPR